MLYSLLEYGVIFNLDTKYGLTLCLYLLCMYIFHVLFITFIFKVNSEKIFSQDSHAGEHEPQKCRRHEHTHVCFEYEPHGQYIQWKIDDGAYDGVANRFSPSGSVFEHTVL